VVTQELAERLWKHPGYNMIADTMSSLAVSADGMAIDPSDQDWCAAERLAKCDFVLAYIDQDWTAYRAAVVELRNALSERIADA